MWCLQVVRVEMAFRRRVNLLPRHGRIGPGGGKGKRLRHAGSGVTFSTQDTKHRLRSYLDLLLNVNVFLQMRRICWRSFSITPQHRSHHLCSALYNKALFQEHKKKERPRRFLALRDTSRIQLRGATLG